MIDQREHSSISDFAQSNPDKAAAILFETGEVLTFRELDAGSIRLARLLSEVGLSRGDRVAILMENCVEYCIAIWGIRRAGMYMVPVNWHLEADEVLHIVQNSNAKALVTSDALVGAAADAVRGNVDLKLKLTFGEAVPDFVSFAEATADLSTERPANELDGAPMYYSGGTTGKPKGILRPLTNEPFGAPSMIEKYMGPTFGLQFDTIYLSPAPLYHASPFGWTMMVQRLGGTVVILRSFDASNVLKAVDQFQITHAQFVPTHFVRLLRLDEACRAEFRLDTLQCVVHAAAPCAPEVKAKMLAWLGPIVYEYYGSSEQCGFTSIGPDEVESHPGSVGRSVHGIIHIVDGETGQELPIGEIGLVYYEGAEPFEYHGHADAASSCFNEKGWATVGDMGRLDHDGYLYLSDRESNMILSGGVNIYPQEIEEVLIVHPAVVDVAVIGLPDEEYGNRVHAVIVPALDFRAGPDLAKQILEYCRSKLASFKCPRSIDFADALPRLPSGKLQKRHLISAYRNGAGKPTALSDRRECNFP